GVSSGDMDPKLSNFDTHERYVGKTDGNGVIKNAPNASVSSASDGFWRVVDNGGVVTQFPVVDNAGVVNYYLLREMDSPYSRADNPLYDPLYNPSPDVIFDLPYHTTNKTTQLDTVTGVRSPVEVAGNVYHLHLFPKNVAKNDLMKTATKVVDVDGKDRGALYAQVGDTISWEVDYRLYNEASPVLGDGKLDIKEIQKYTGKNRNGKDYAVVFADRLPSGLKMLGGSPGVDPVPQVKLNWQDASGAAHSAPIDAKYNAAEGEIVISSRRDSQGNYVVGTGMNLYRNVINNEPWWDQFIFPFASSSLDYFLPDDTDPQLNGNLWAFALSVGDFTRVFLDESSVSGVSHLWLSWTYETKLTGGGGDFVGHRSGLLVNEVAAETIDSIQIKDGSLRADAVVATPGLQFGKSNKPEEGDLLAYGAPYAIFRLTRPEDRYGSMSFLYEDGNFYDADSEGTPQGPPNGVKPVQAMSTNSGIVTFVGIPIVKKDPRDPNSPGKVTELKFGLYEYKEAEVTQGIVYIRPERVFKYVDFSEYAGKTPAELVRTRGGKGVAADINKLDFGPYQCPLLLDDHGVPRFTDNRGQQIDKVLMNWRPGQADPGKVGALPLTGGRGILNMLFVGIVLMIMGLAYRKLKHDKVLSSGPAHAGKQ
ncbi:hypothetical protein, partial [Bombiscardovia coagulans]